MPRTPRPTFVLEMPLRTTQQDERRLDDRLEVGKRLANVGLQDGLHIVTAMRSDPAWDAARTMPRSTEAQRKARAAAFTVVREHHGFTKNAFESMLIAHKNAAGFAGRIGAHETQKLAERLFTTLNKWVLGLGGRPRFKGHRRPLHSLEGKNNGGMLQWKPEAKALQVETGWQIPVVLPDLDKDEWFWAALQATTKYCRLVWRRIRGRKQWYLQLMQDGVAPMKASLLSRLAAEGSEGGLDIGPSTIAYATDTEAGVFRFCAEVERPHREVRRLQRHLDRQRRANNPDNYQPDGMIRKGKKAWMASARQKQTETALQEALRHEAAVRKHAHGRDINTLLSKARHWRDDGVSSRALQQRYGKSIAVRGPGAFMSELERKADRAGGSRTIIEVRHLKNSQYCHSTNDFEKKPLKERWHHFRDGRGRVQRDVYSAFLARNSRGSTYEPPVLEKAWARLVPALAIQGLYAQHSTASERDTLIVLPAPVEAAAGRSGSIALQRAAATRPPETVANRGGLSPRRLLETGKPRAVGFGTPRL